MVSKWGHARTAVASPDPATRGQKRHKWNTPKIVQQMGKVSYRLSRIFDKFWNMENMWNILTKKRKRKPRVKELHPKKETPMSLQLQSMGAE